MATQKLAEQYKEILRPHQLGVGTPKGAEIAVHCLRRYIDSNKENNKVILKIDYKNAFNTLRRDKILEKVRSDLPTLYPMAWQAYSTPSNLYYHDTTVIPSQEGVQQCCPLGPLLFSLAVADLMKSCNSELNLWYLDDATLAGDPEVVKEDLAKINQSADTLGLKINSKKCELFFTNSELRETNERKLLAMRQHAP